jgi:type I restriction enzyme, S subunit
MNTWDKLQLRHVFTVNSGSTPESGKGFYWDGEIAWVTPEDLSNMTDEIKLCDTRRKLTEDGYNNCGATIVAENSIVLTKRAPIGLLAILGIKACSNQGCFLLTPKKMIEPMFYYYFLLANKSLLQVLGRGSTFMELSLDEIKAFTVPLPPLQIQQEISAFLYNATMEIDNLVSAKKKFIQFLSQKRQALITQAVTRGLNPKAKMKATGMEWLGDVPAHWGVKKIKHITSKIGSGITPKGGAEVYQNSGIPILRSQNIHFAGLKLDDVAYISEDLHYSMSNSKVLAGDVLLNITGASIGRCYYYDGSLGEANVNQHVCILRPKSEIATNYLYYYFASEIGQLQIHLSQTGGGREGLSFESLKTFIIPLPNIEEQKKILDYIEYNCKKIDLLRSATEQSISLLTERRTALITAAVTGQPEIN